MFYIERGSSSRTQGKLVSIFEITSHSLILICLVSMLAACATTPAPASSASSESLTSISKSTRVDFDAGRLPSESWRRAYRTLGVQGWQQDTASLHALFVLGLRMRGEEALATRYDAHVFDQIARTYEPGEAREQWLTHYKKMSQNSLPELDPEQQRSIEQQRDFIAAPFRELTLIDPLAAALMAPSTSSHVTLDGTQLEALTSLMRSSHVAGATSQTHQWLTRYESDLARLQHTSPEQWLTLTIQWHALHSVSGMPEDKLAEQLNHQPPATLPSHLHVRYDAWLCSIWGQLGMYDRALKACQRASALSSTASSTLLLDTIDAARATNQIDLAIDAISKLPDMSLREIQHRKLFDHLSNTGQHELAVSHARAFLDDPELLLATARESRANPEKERERQELWSTLLTQPDELYTLRADHTLYAQLETLHELALLAPDYPDQLVGLDEIRIVDEIIHLEDASAQLRGLTWFTVKQHVLGRDVSRAREPLRKAIEGIHKHPDARGIASLYHHDRELLAELIVLARPFPALLDDFLQQVEHAADLVGVLDHLTASAFDEVALEERRVWLARFVELPVLRPGDGVQRDRALWRHFDDRSFRDVFVASIFARRDMNEVDVGQLKTFYGEWSATIMLQDGGLDELIAMVEREATPEERDVMSAAVIEVLYRWPVMPDGVGLEQIERVQSWSSAQRRSVVYRARLTNLRARLGQCDESAALRSVAFAPALPDLVAMCRDQISPETLHALLERGESDRARFARELAFALLYD